MAFFPYFVLSPNTITSLVGIVHGPDRTVPTPPEDWRQATIDVVIPALDEEGTLPLCLASIARQTVEPTRIILVDDGSRDRTAEVARSFCEQEGIELTVIQRRRPIGKTPTIKRQAREFVADVEFVLDADTILESPDYIERTVEKLYEAVGIASACGTILPLRRRDRLAAAEWPAVRRFREASPDVPVVSPTGWAGRLRQAVTDLYRDALYTFLQGVLYRGQMLFWGSITNPVGCAVAYRQKYVADLFDRYEPVLGDDLTNSEDIFIGFALLNEGYRNIQLHDVTARTVEPGPGRMPRQVYMWSSAFLQSCYYFDALVRSPLRALRRRLHLRRGRRAGVEERRTIREPYRQAFGTDHTHRYGRPVGWTLFMAAVEKIAFPVTLLLLVLFQWWEALAITVAAETAVSVSFLTAVAKGRRLEYFAKGLVTTPLRYGTLAFDLYTIARFATDLWLRRDRRWRK